MSDIISLLSIIGMAIAFLVLSFSIGKDSTKDKWIEQEYPQCIERKFGNEVVKKCYKLVEVKE